MATIGNKVAASDLTLSALGAAASSHNHSASQITSGTLPLARGGTGVTSLAALKNLIGVGTPNNFIAEIIPWKGHVSGNGLLSSSTITVNLPYQVDFNKTWLVTGYVLGTGWTATGSSATATCFDFDIVTNLGTKNNPFSTEMIRSLAGATPKDPTKWGYYPRMETVLMSPLGWVEVETRGYMRGTEEGWLAGGTTTSASFAGEIGTAVAYRGVNIKYAPYCLGFYLQFQQMN